MAKKSSASNDLENQGKEKKMKEVQLHLVMRDVESSYGSGARTSLKVLWARQSLEKKY